MISNVPRPSLFPQAAGTEATSEETAQSLKIKEDILSDYWGSELDLFSLKMGGPRQSVSSLGGLGLDLSTTHITRQFGTQLPDKGPWGGLWLSGGANQG